MKFFILTFLTAISIIISSCSINNNRINDSDINKAFIDYITNYDLKVSVGDSVKIIDVLDSKDLQIVKLAFEVTTVKSNKTYNDTINLLKNKNNNKCYTVELKKID